MRPSNKQRSRNKPGGNGGHNNNPRRNLGNIINRVFESAGPDSKVRGTPQQIIDKYNALARDAQVSGDRVAAENYLQHSEHYSRLLGEAQRQQGEQQRFGQDRDDGPRDEDTPEQPQFQAQPQPPAQFQPRPQPQPQETRVASGLTTIDPDDTEEPAGPIETPEGRSQPMGDPRRGGEPSAASNGTDRAEAAPEDAPERPKRPRPRRRPKSEAGGAGGGDVVPAGD